MRTVPEPVAELIRDIFEEAGERWLAALPDLIADRCDAWDLEITGEAFTGGTHSYVAPVRRADGSSAVLKLTVVDEENRAEATALHHYNGEGAVKLYDYDPGTGAMLMELATPGSPLVQQSYEGVVLEGSPENADKIDIASALYRRLWREPVATPGYPSLPLVRDLVAVWESEIPANADGELPAHLVAQAVDLCRELAKPDGPEGIVNRDTHLGNIVAAQREPWLLIDPKPLLGERAFDAGFFIDKQIHHRPEAGFACQVVARTAEGLGVAPERARAWAFLRAMENAAWAVDDELPERVASEVAIAEALR
ncbi:aminoglycoside phosphotransferase family protein [Stackebrandtia nassauensis]|uniref:6-kinase n=1 Tax=Stackebrandtia nassauensis (strain DSM 44728 / CIP 108903 / NRRL B-16338 / NBRC 102104 / LLR-40K-21) TaxID=446470 RepID=D3Q2G9_STANL|nr:aminoglycoside phosphotransferase family protein [Stackebrandtia nassauensis]ADD43902.1 6-kinase [Stackebrandtia nassauensis DSM 44728]